MSLQKPRSPLPKVASESRGKLMIAKLLQEKRNDDLFTDPSADGEKKGKENMNNRCDSKHRNGGE